MSGRLIEKAAPVLEDAVAYGAGKADEADLAAILGLLSRVRSLEQRLHEAVALADRALEIAERLDLYEVLAGCLITKGNILAQHGRPIEGLSLIAAARELANDYTLPAIESRALTSLTIVMASRDVRATWDLEQEAIAFARRIGRRDMELTLIGNAGEDALRLGFWDWVEEEMQPFEDADLPLGQRITVDLARTVPRLLRGDPEIEATAESVRAAIISAHDTDMGSTASDLDGWVALSAGAFAQARDAWLTQAADSDTNAPFALPRAGKSALLARDAAGARETLDLLTLNGTRGLVLDVERVTIEAGIAAIEGRTGEAVAGYRLALGRWAEMGLPWDQAWAAWTAVVVLGPTVPEARAWGAASRPILEQLGARPLLALLDDALRDPDGASPSSRDGAGSGITERSRG